MVYEVAVAMKYALRMRANFTSLRSNFMSEGHFILRKQYFIYPPVFYT